ncbi:MAG: MerR family transcriptional regulator [Methanobacteriaceae archaeon]|nr:MerR family transcriptional regulator [Methanobacteriaceae archaeon]
MIIKEIESLSGMTRANIRFYEFEGLLLPARNSNGYRDYSEKDLEILKRIKLLRMLHFSLEEIKSLHTGEQELVDALDQHLAKLEAEKADIEQSQEICKVMHSDGVRYQTLNAQQYLNAIASITKQPVLELVEDSVPKVHSPWRRFFARNLDFFIYSTLWAIFLSFVMNINIVSRNAPANFLDAAIAMLFMIFIEPLMLTLFGTTVGKWTLGLSVKDNDDRRLSYSEAFARTWTVLWRGMGLNIPIYNLVRQWKSYKACDEGETLEWEYNSTITLRDQRVWRVVAFIFANVILFAALFLTVSAADMPKHRGDITVSEFCENYNRLSDYYGLNNGNYLNDDGKWVEEEDIGYVINIDGDLDEPEFIFTEDDGIMTGMRFTTELQNSDVWAPSYQNEMILSIMSFVRARQGYSLLSNDVKALIEQISSSPFEDFHFTAHGISITCNVEYSGYMDTVTIGTLCPKEDAERFYSLDFIMVKE